MNTFLNKTFLPFWLIIPIVLNFSSCLTIPLQDKKAQRETEATKVQLQLIISYLNQGLPQSALKELRPALRKSPKHFDLNNLMGLTQLALKNPRKAVFYLEKSYSLKKSQAIALNLSSAYIAAKMLRKAEKTLTELLKSESFSQYLYPERVFHNLGLVYEKQSKKPLAIQHYQLALDENPFFYQTLIRLAAVYKGNKGQSSQRYLLKAKKACPKCWEPIQELCRLYLNQNRPKLAQRELRAFMKNQEASSNHKIRARKLLRYANALARTSYR